MLVQLKCRQREGHRAACLSPPFGVDHIVKALVLLVLGGAHDLKDLVRLVHLILACTGRARAGQVRCTPCNTARTAVLCAHTPHTQLSVCRCVQQ